MPPAACTNGSTISAASSLARPTTVRSKRANCCLAGRQRHDHLVGEHAAEQRVHALFRVTHGHRGERIAVIGVLEAQEPGTAKFALVEPVLQRHLHRDLDRDRAGLAEKNVLEITGQHRRKPPRQILDRRVNEPTQHDVRH